MTRHEWREQEGEEVRFWRANFHGGDFSLYTRTKEDPDWLKLDPPSVGDLEKLREVLWRKYQRKRCPWKFVAKVDQLLGRPDASKD